MGERLHYYDMTAGFAEVMLVVFEDEYRRGQRDVDAIMRRLKDLSAYSLTHAEIMDQREGVELLALGMFFGMTSQPGLRYKNQERLNLLSDEAIAYQGQAERIEQEVTQRKKPGLGQNKDSQVDSLQMRLL
ncbi:MAG: hypothetical protein H6667_25445 [Ardenticatenaceae bacterium]|nr:hypothetical protein [Ardenticatenaceae bacterium]